MARLLGRLGWHGQCVCCNGPRDKNQIRRGESRAWRGEALADLLQEPGATGRGAHALAGHGRLTLPDATKET